MTRRSPRSRSLPGHRAARAAAPAVGLVLALAVLAGCGGDEGTAGTAQDPAAGTTGASAAGSATAVPTDPTSTDAASPSVTGSPTDGGGVVPVVLPECATVWVDGQRLPGGYEGCTEDGEEVPADGRYCEFGKPLFVHDRTSWAVAGGAISTVQGDLLDDPGYRDALAKCSG